MGKSKSTHGNTKHGMTRTRVFRAWNSMLYRCNTPSCRDYHRYGARGINVSADWESFENFFRDMGQPPTAKHTLDRIDNNGGYSKENCRWATAEEQAANTRNSKLLTHDGVTLPIRAWARKLGVDVRTIRRRLKRYSVDNALSRKLYHKGL